MAKLHQIIAIEEDQKNKTGSVIAALDREAAQPDNFNGLTRVYRPKDDSPGAETLPAETKRVQYDTLKEIEKFVKAKSPLIDLTATKDRANMDARADVEVDGNVLIADVLY